MSTLYPPTHCPGCGDHLRLDEDALSDGADATPCAKPHEKSFRVQHDACGWQGYVDPDDRWDRPDVDVVSELRAALTAALARAEALTQALADRDEVIRENQEQLAKFVEVCRQREAAARERDALAVRLDAAMQAEVERNSAVAALSAALSRQRRVVEDIRELAAELREGHKALLTGEPFRPNMLGVWEGALIALADELSEGK